MSSSQEQLKKCLEELLGAIGRADGEAINRTLQSVDDLLKRHGTEWDPRLVHFVERRSYGKALELLGGGGAAPGSCGKKEGGT